MDITGNYNMDRFEDNFGAHENEMVELQPYLDCCDVDETNQEGKSHLYGGQQFLCDGGCGEEVTWFGAFCRDCVKYIVNG